MTKLIERFFDDQQTMQKSLLANTEYQLEKAIQQRSEATLMVSGGSTPKPLYQSLSNTNVAWNKVTVAMVDERWVAEDSEASNERFIRLNLLRNRARNSRLVKMKLPKEQATLAEEVVNRQYQAIKAPYDVTILGMGNDGHTASLFPDAQGIEEALTSKERLCSAINAKASDVTGEFTERMTLTLNAISNSRLIKLLITGQDKLNTYKKAIAGQDIFEMPIRAVLQQSQTPVIVYWAP
ncbi:6-phosphogluconolactonase [Aliikangiella coralliicola]|uniref:6-phosphogluconolactonase n=1 Tax=Aliikangiella coralliicola TaxID=2592383 RepID=A0A545UHP5_9GAMM|nr:6-phosphogluconolactonase [Aliikangiella coralliicola]TQV88933.1 6-phosphogluconolactonase [Aliikangiella coralliicola]